MANNVFIPIAAGGGINKIEDVELLFQNGADKVVLNTSLYNNPTLANSVIDRYGSQSVVASVDYKLIEGTPNIYINDGSIEINQTLSDYLLSIEKLGVGEILLNSINKDGTGFGYDIGVIEEYTQKIKIPVIVLGGAGNENHLHKGILIDGVEAVATANLFNFVGDGLPKARKYMQSCGINLADWS